MKTPSTVSWSKRISESESRPTTTSLHATLDLPNATVSVYLQEADQRNLTPVEIITERLIRCAGHTSQKPLYFTDDNRRDLESLLGHNFDRPDQVIQQIRLATKITVGPTDITLGPNLTARLKSRCFGKPFEEFLKEIILQGLEQYVGLR